MPKKSQQERKSSINPTKHLPNQFLLRLSLKLLSQQSKAAHLIKHKIIKITGS
jgi:hypothetical protein